MLGYVFSLLLLATPSAASLVPEAASAESGPLPGAGPRVVPMPGYAVPVDDLYERILVYKREQLEVRPVRDDGWVAPLTLSRDDSYDGYNGGPDAGYDGAYDAGYGGGYDDGADPAWNAAAPGFASSPSHPGSAWGVVRGAAQVLDDAQFADLLQDRALQQRIASERFWPRFWWGMGFGAVSAASLGTGAWMTWRGYDGGDAKRNGEAIGISLLSVGVATGVLAALYPAYAQHVLTPPEAAMRCDAYNAALRERLRLGPEDLQRF